MVASNTFSSLYCPLEKKCCSRLLKADISGEITCPKHLIISTSSLWVGVLLVSCPIYIHGRGFSSWLWNKGWRRGSTSYRYDSPSYLGSLVDTSSPEACILTNSFSWYVFLSRTIRFFCDGLLDALFHDWQRSVLFNLSECCSWSYCIRSLGFSSF